MTTPFRIKCADPADLPSNGKIRAITESGKHVVFEFPKKIGINKRPIIDSLSRSFPDHSVFDSGGNKDTDCVTVMPVIAIESVHSHAEKIKAAVASYIETVSFLLTSHAQGILAPEWSSFVHGEHRRFENASTGQIVEVPLDGPPSPENVDPYFFSEFVKSTPGLDGVASLIKHDFHDAARMLNVLFKPKPG